jgi:hypothetical protein
MTPLVLGSVALATVAALSFALVARTRSRAIPKQPNVARSSKAHQLYGDQGQTSKTIARVLSEVEQLAMLKERGALTEAEFKAEKAMFLQAMFLRVDDDRPELPRRRPVS